MTHGECPGTNTTLCLSSPAVRSRSKRFDGRVAIVTGGASGLGRVTAELLAAEGATVAVFDIEEHEAARVVADIRLSGGDGVALRVDVSNALRVEEAVREVADAHGRIDVLINNAGIPSHGTVLEIDMEHWKRVIAINLTSCFLCSRAVIPVMRRTGGGAIVCVSSASGLMGQRSQVAYNVSKHGVIGLVRCMAADHAGDGIRVNAICPGSIDTPMLNALPTDEHLERVKAGNVFRRLAAPTEIANEILHLVSDESSFMTGAAVTVDGGSTSILMSLE